MREDGGAVAFEVLAVLDTGLIAADRLPADITDAVCSAATVALMRRPSA
jgi:hypothetical protein